MELQSFGPLVAVGLVGWSVLAIRQRRLLPIWPWDWPSPHQVRGLAAAMTAALLAYWASRLALGMI